MRNEALHVEGYDIYRKDREGEREGGVIIMTKELRVKEVIVNDSVSEVVSVTIRVGH